jgi:hypothetical protein
MHAAFQKRQILLERTAAKVSGEFSTLARAYVDVWGFYSVDDFRSTSHMRSQAQRLHGLTHKLSVAWNKLCRTVNKTRAPTLNMACAEV